MPRAATTRFDPHAAAHAATRPTAHAAASLESTLTLVVAALGVVAGIAAGATVAAAAPPPPEARVRAEQLRTEDHPARAIHQSRRNRDTHAPAVARFAR